MEGKHLCGVIGYIYLSLLLPTWKEPYLRFECFSLRKVDVCNECTSGVEGISQKSCSFYLSNIYSEWALFSPKKAILKVTSKTSLKCNRNLSIGINAVDIWLFLPAYVFYILLVICFCFVDLFAGKPLYLWWYKKWGSIILSLRWLFTFIIYSAGST